MSAVPMLDAVSIFDALPDAEKRKWEAERRIIRAGIKGAKKIPRRDREALMYLTNLWFYHRNGDGFIHPGAALLGEKLECSVRTAKDILKRHRASGYLVPLAYDKGGRNATWYAVDLAKILDDLCSPRPFQMQDFHDIKRRSYAHVNRAKSAVNRAKTAHGNNNNTQEEPMPEVFNDPSDWMEVPF